MSERPTRLPWLAAAGIAALAGLLLSQWALARRDLRRTRELADRALSMEYNGLPTDASIKLLQDAVAQRISSAGWTPRKPWSSRASVAVLDAMLARLLFDKGRWEEAGTAALAAKRLGSHEADGIYARSLVRGARLVEALSAYNEAVASDPTVPALYAERGEVQLRLVQLDDSIADETKALQLGASGPVQIKALLVRGRARLAANDSAGGLADLGALIQIEPGNPLARLLRGQTLYQQRDFDGAVADATALAKLDPTNGEAYLLRAQANLAMGRRADARKDLREAQKLMPGHPRVTELFEQLRKPS